MHLLCICSHLAVTAHSVSLSYCTIHEQYFAIFSFRSIHSGLNPIFNADKIILTLVPFEHCWKSFFFQACGILSVLTGGQLWYPVVPDTATASSGLPVAAKWHIVGNFFCLSCAACRPAARPIIMTSHKNTALLWSGAIWRPSTSSAVAYQWQIHELYNMHVDFHLMTSFYRLVPFMGFSHCICDPRLPLVKQCSNISSIL